MTARLAALGLLLVWAGLYLPALGTTEIKGEEGRRILPALSMIESGNWLVPQLSGEAYLRKPPLINWFIALSMKVTGQREEWTARLPSVLGILALGLFTLAATTPWLRPDGGLMAAIFVIGSVSLVEKGRLAEIEALYVAWTGMATIWWMRGFRLQANPWSTWLVCGFFLGLGLLTKGPLHFLFFYVMVVAVCLRERSPKEFFNLAHLVGLILAFGMFAAWMIPYIAATQSGEAAATWREQFIERVTGSRFDLEAWLLSVPRGLSNFLPWVILVPLLWHRTLSQSLSPRETSLLKGGGNALAILYVGMLLVPGVLARYTMPMLPAFSVLLALVMRDQIPRITVRGWRIMLVITVVALILACLAAPFVGGWSLAGAAGGVFGLILCVLVWQRLQSLTTASALTGATAVLMVAGMFVYAIAVVPRMVAGDDLRPVGNAISTAVPAGSVLHVVDIGYQPELFYVKIPLQYHASWKQVPADAEWCLIRSKKRKHAAEKRPDLAEAAKFFVKLDQPLLLLKGSPLPSAKPNIDRDQK